jgi:hypothetical protein
VRVADRLPRGRAGQTGLSKCCRSSWPCPRQGKTSRHPLGDHGCGWAALSFKNARYNRHPRLSRASAWGHALTAGSNAVEAARAAPAWRGSPAVAARVARAGPDRRQSPDAAMRPGRLCRRRQGPAWSEASAESTPPARSAERRVMSRRFPQRPRWSSRRWATTRPGGRVFRTTATEADVSPAVLHPLGGAALTLFSSCYRAQAAVREYGPILRGRS